MILRGSIYSNVLEMKTSISVLIPYHFQTAWKEPADKPYKVVFLLHGLAGNNGNWTDYTMLPFFSKNSHTIFIMPDVGRSFYADQKYGQKFFTYVAEELPDISRRLFHISSRAKDTAVMGCSMGGYGALKVGLSRQETFGTICAISPALLNLGDFLKALRTAPDPQKANEYYTPQMLTDFKAIFGEDLKAGPGDDIVKLAQKLSSAAVPAAKKPGPKIYCTCGTEDALMASNRRFNEQVKKLNLNFTFEEIPGGHDWDVFNRGLERSLGFFLKK
jgi:S-formylglutathione hydrolase FrmB